MLLSLPLTLCCAAPIPHAPRSKAPATTAPAAVQDDAAVQGSLDADDWARFRGPGGHARRPDEGYPVEWDDETHVLWRAALPGPGSSSPIVVGSRILVTCWTGGGAPAADPAADPAPNGAAEGAAEGDAHRSDAPPETAAAATELRRHMLCYDRDEGTLLWQASVGPSAVEDPYEGRLTTHGYTSSTPVSDGERVFVFHGKRGVLAYDLDGRELWHQDLGQSSSEWNTGSASSPVLCGDLLVVNAADESRSLRALRKEDGEEAWRIELEGLDLAFDTPVLAGEGSSQVLVFALLEQIWGLDPQTGEQRWVVHTKSNASLAPSIVVGDGVVYSIGGQSGERAYAVRLGGTGDVTDTHVLWRSRYGAYVPSPVLVGGHLYWVDDRGMAHCMSAEDGSIVYRERLDQEFYASVVAAGERLYAVSREGGTYVLAAEPEFEVVAHNVLAGDESRFDGSPALSRGQLFLRSDRFLYCLEGL